MKTKNLLWGIASIVLLALIIFAIVKATTGPGKHDDFAVCMTEKGAVMYGTDWCSSCKAQKALFGKSFKYIDYKNCDFNKDLCTQKGIQGYPTWIINDKAYTGKKPLDYLAYQTNCSLT